jgi:hypothetical protein
VRYSDEGMRAVGAAWTELGVNIGQVLKAEGFGVLSAGANLRYLQAHAGAAIGITDLEYTVVDTALAMVHSATLDYGFAMPAANAGNGFGADLGLTYTRTIDEADGYMPHRSSGGCSPAAYRYRVGLSLLDLGGMRFRSAQAGRLEAGMLQIDDYTDMPLSDASDADRLSHQRAGIRGLRHDAERERAQQLAHATRQQHGGRAAHRDEALRGGHALGLPRV